MMNTSLSVLSFWKIQKSTHLSASFQNSGANVGIRQRQFWTVVDDFYWHSNFKGKKQQGNSANGDKRSVKVFMGIASRKPPVIYYIITDNRIVRCKISLPSIIHCAGFSDGREQWQFTNELFYCPIIRHRLIVDREGGTTLVYPNSDVNLGLIKLFNH